MFYLKMFYKVIWDLRLRGLSFFILSIGLFALAANSERVKSFIAVKVTPQNPYFNALVNKSINANVIARKLQNLPGVKNVKVKSSDYLKNDLRAIAKEIDPEVVKNMMNVSFQGIKVELDRTLEKSSQSLVQEYLNRLVGKENITITGVKYPKVNMVASNKDLRHFFLQWVDIVLIFCISIVWCFACWSISKELRSNAYLIEKFQRKNMVALKSFLIGMLAIIFVVLNILNIIGGNIFNLLLLLAPLTLLGMTFNINQFKYLKK